MNTRMTDWIRAFLISAALRGAILGLTGFVAPAEIQIPLQLTPLNAAFVSALYLAGTLGLILTLFARDRADARPFLVGTGVVTALLLSVTLAHWAAFETALSTTLVMWVGSYIFDPLATTLLVTTHGLLRPAQPGRHRLTWLFVAEASVLGTVGLLMLALPATAAALWPWTIPPLVAQLYSCFFLAFAVIALLVAYDRRPIAIRNVAITSLALIGGVLGASLLYLGRFGGGPATWVWFAALLVGVGAFGAALVGRTPRQMLATGALRILK